MIKHTHEGRWESDDGTVWVLVEPSEIWATINASNSTTYDGYVITDNGNGTGTRTVYDENGEIVSTEQLTGLEIPQPPEPSPEEKLAAVTARLDKLAPVRSEHDVPADPTYLPPATDLRTPR